MVGLVWWVVEAFKVNDRVRQWNADRALEALRDLEALPAEGDHRREPRRYRSAVPERVRILVDVHEQRSGIPELLRELGAEVEIVSLPAGDYACGLDTIVERKRVLDLHAAITKGSLWPQLAKLRGACGFPYLLVEGTHLDRGPLHPNAIRGACLAAIDQGIALLRSMMQQDSAQWIHRLAVRCQQVERPADRPVYAQRPKPAPEDTREAMLAAVPGVSAVTARALLERFGTIGELLAAGPGEWQRVPGVGPERVRALCEAFDVAMPVPGKRRRQAPG